MPRDDAAAVAALTRLVNIAHTDTGQARRVANFLLAWWNAQAYGGFDLTDLWAVDDAIAEDMLVVTQLIARRRNAPAAYGLGPEFEHLAGLWRPATLQPAQ